jgi:hypothetical protein
MEEEYVRAKADEISKPLCDTGGHEAQTHGDDADKQHPVIQGRLFPYVRN